MHSNNHSYHISFIATLHSYNPIFHSFTDRKIQVSVRSSFSSFRDVYSGVPQGSAIGSLLFLVYINHVCFKLCSKHKIFADDINKDIFMCIWESLRTMPNDCWAGSSLQNDIDMLNSTTKSWGLKINREKWAVLHSSRRFKDLVLPHYTLDGHPLPVLSVSLQSESASWW